MAFIDGIHYTAYTTLCDGIHYTAYTILCDGIHYTAYTILCDGINYTAYTILCNGSSDYLDREQHRAGVMDHLFYGTFICSTDHGSFVLLNLADTTCAKIGLIRAVYAHSAFRAIAQQLTTEDSYR